MGVGGQRHAPAALCQKRPATHCIGFWVGPRADLDGCRKSPPPPAGFDPRTFQAVASRYTDCAIQAFFSSVITREFRSFMFISSFA
jgi:hypothetical protein